MSSLKDYLSGRTTPTSIDDTQKIYGILNDESVAVTAGLISKNTQQKVYNEKTTSNYDFVLTDANNVIDRNVATANTVTIPPNADVAFPLGTWLWVNAIDEITLWVAGSGVTITSSSGELTCIGQLIPTGARKIGTNSWHLYNGKSSAQIRSDIFCNNFFPKIKKGVTNNRFYGTGMTSSSPGTQGLAANTLYAWPMIISESLTLDTIQAEVTGGVALSSIRIGIYADDGSCYPGDLVYGSAALSSATNGVKSETLTPSTVLVNPGLYWLAIVSDNAPAMRSWTINSTPNILGIVATMGAANPSQGYSIAYTFGALPSPFSASAGFATTTNAHMILVRALS